MEITPPKHKGNKELIGNNERGILIEPNDVQQLSETIIFLLSNKDHIERASG